MSDNMEPIAGAGGELRQPPQQPSQTSTVQTSPVDAKSLAAALKSDKEFLDAVANQVRSVHDKRVVSHETRIKDIEGALARVKELKDEGWSEQQAVRIMKLEDAGIAPEPVQPQPSAQPMPVSAVGASQQASSVSDLTIEGYANFLGIDPKSAEYVELSRTSPDKQILLQKITDLSEQRKQVQSPSPAAVLPAGQANTPIPKPDLQAQYRNEVDAALTKEAKLQVRRKYRALGLEL